MGKFYSAYSNFKCWRSTAAVLVCEYLFTLLKAKDDPARRFLFHHLY